MKLQSVDPVFAGGFSATWLVLLGIIPVLVAWRVGKALCSPLRSVPGPFLARFTRLWYLKNVWSGKFEQVNIDLHKRYGESLTLDCLLDQCDGI
jgi:hypothetical protein